MMRAVDELFGIKDVGARLGRRPDRKEKESLHEKILNCATFWKYPEELNLSSSK